MIKAFVLAAGIALAALPAQAGPGTSCSAPYSDNPATQALAEQMYAQCQQMERQNELLEQQQRRQRRNDCLGRRDLSRECAIEMFQ